MPIPNNTGSLPNLTALYMSSPLATPIDGVEDMQLQQQQLNHDSLSPSTASHSHVGALRPTTNPQARRRMQQHGQASTGLAMGGVSHHTRHNLPQQASRSCRVLCCCVLQNVVDRDAVVVMLHDSRLQITQFVVHISQYRTVSYRAVHMIVIFLLFCCCKTCSVAVDLVRF